SGGDLPRDARLVRQGLRQREQPPDLPRPRRRHPRAGNVQVHLLGRRRRAQLGPGPAGDPRLRRRGAKHPLTAPHPGKEHAVSDAPPNRWVRHAVALCARSVLATVAGLLVWTVLPMALGWQPAVVLSGSMEPAIRTGDVVL